MTTVGLLILAIGALAAVSAWLLAWYRGRQAEASDPDLPPPDPAADAEAPEVESAMADATDAVPDPEADPPDPV